MQRFFEVTSPSVHRMVKELESMRLIRRTPRTARSIELLVDPDDLLCFDEDSPIDQVPCDRVLVHCAAQPAMTTRGLVIVAQ